jgi:hypothetical protein
MPAKPGAAFRWPVAAAFEAAVIACAFTGGDLSYDDPAAYEAPCRQDAAKTPRHALQVRRAADLTSSFEANWNAGVSPDRWDYPYGRCRRVEATRRGAVQPCSGPGGGVDPGLRQGRATAASGGAPRLAQPPYAINQPQRGAEPARAGNGRATTIRVGTAATASQMALF